MSPFISRLLPKKSRQLIFYLLIISCILGTFILAKNTIPFLSIVFSNEDSSPDDTFVEYTSQLFVDEISSNTLNLFYTLEDQEAYGITDPTITFGEYATDSTLTSLAIENQLSLLSTFDYHSLSPENQLTYDVLIDYFTTAQLGTSYTLYYEPLTPYTGLHTQLPILLAEFPLNSESDVITYLALLETLPEYFDSLLNFQQAKSEAGLFMSDTQLDTVLEDCIAFIEMKDNYLLSTFESRIASIEGIDAEDVAQYSTTNATLVDEVIIPTYIMLADGLETLRGTGTNANGLCYYENGRNYYAYLVKANTGSSRTIPEIQLLIQNQMLDDSLDLQDAYLELEDGTIDIPDIDATYEELLVSLENSMTNLFPEAPEVSVTINTVPEALEPFLSPAFYLIPTIDNTTENTIYMNNAYMTDDVTLYTTLAHEGYPGHLYQTTYFASTSPDPVRSLFSYGGYLEGWATYAEMCSYYLGIIDSPEDAILQKSASLNLALYAYVDIGIHYEGWTLSDVIAYFYTYGVTDSETIMKIYDLIVATPSNYLKYYLGYLEFLELKKECIDTWGADFSQARFHEAVLEIGPVSFDVLRKYVLE